MIFAAFFVKNSAKVRSLYWSEDCYRLGVIRGLYTAIWDSLEENFDKDETLREIRYI